MSRYCPIYKRNVVYLDCLECDTKECREISNLPNKNNNDKPLSENAQPTNNTTEL